MSLYLVAGHGAATAPASLEEHLPTGRHPRYPSDTTDTEWQILAGYIPVGGTVAGRGGGPVIYPRRDIVDAIRYVDHNSCVWRALPVDFPPWPTVYHYFRTWNRDGTLTALHNGLREHLRQAEGRHPEPSAAILDSQSIRAAETVARASRGFDAGNYAGARIMPGVMSKALAKGSSVLQWAGITHRTRSGQAGECGVRGVCAVCVAG